MIAQEKAPDFTLADIDGEQFSLSAYRGRVVLIDLFRVDPPCPACIYAIPHLKGVYSQYSRDEVILMSISVSSLDTDEILRSDFVEEYNIPWIVACGGDYIAYLYSVSAVPTLVIVDAEGNMYKHIGVTEESKLISEIDNLLSGEDGSEPNGDSDGTLPGIPIEIIGIIGVAVVSALVIGIVVVGRVFQWSKPAKKRHKHKH